MTILTREQITEATWGDIKRDPRLAADLTDTALAYHDTLIELERWGTAANVYESKLEEALIEVERLQAENASLRAWCAGGLSR